MATIDQLPAFSQSAEGFIPAPPSFLPGIVSAPLTFDPTATTLVRQNGGTYSITMAELLACAAAAAATAINGGFRIPEGGTTGQVLAKVSNATGDLQWANSAAIGADQDGGSASTAYLAEQSTDGGAAGTTYTDSQTIDGGVAATVF